MADLWLKYVHTCNVNIEVAKRAQRKKSAININWLPAQSKKRKQRCSSIEPCGETPQHSITPAIKREIKLNLYADLVGDWQIRNGALSN